MRRKADPINTDTDIERSLVHPASDLFSYLTGHWHLTRHITDHNRNETGQLNGEAVFTPAPDGLVYRERGLLQLGDYTGEATQSLRFHPAECGAAVHFADGHPFYSLDLSAGSDSALHLCPPDEYGVATRVISADEWRQTWRVRGPAKDQQIISVFCRRP
ncbi:MAG: DUF6314 family protein [Rhodospirillales bacterium]